MNIIIGIAGKARAGKSTFADALNRVWGGTAHYRPFAGPLKAMLEVIGVDVSDDAKNAPVPFLAGPTPRIMMQTLGTDWGRSIDPDLWVKVWRHSLPKTGLVLVPDVRFENEAAAIRAAGGLVCHVRREITADMAAVPAHRSEAGIRVDICDWVVDNTSIAALERVAEQILVK